MLQIRATISFMFCSALAYDFGLLWFCPLYTAPTYSPPAVRAPLPDAAPVAPQQAAPVKTLPGNSNKFRQVVILVQSGLTAYGYYAGALTAWSTRIRAQP
ncbi:hypothetical protein [Rhizobium ruizarguesonis]|jgi:hypothetical protein|nr:hypothetical protein [Rhizobium ruizarguesonis]